MAVFLFYFAALLIVWWSYHRMGDTMAFGFVAAGVFISTFFLRRAIKQVTGE